MTAALKEPALLLAGQRALMTGVNSGIGMAVAKGLAVAGASVVVNYVSNEKVARQVENDISDYVTGTTLFVDGGMMLYPGFQTGG